MIFEIFLLCLLWAIYSQLMQRYIFPEASTLQNLWSFILNFIFCPFAIILAIINFNTHFKKKVD